MKYEIVFKQSEFNDKKGRGYFIVPDRETYTRRNEYDTVVLKGSPLVYRSNASLEKYKNTKIKETRIDLKNEGIISNNVFVSDYTFKSLNKAAQIILGQTINIYRDKLIYIVDKDGNEVELGKYFNIADSEDDLSELSDESDYAEENEKYIRFKKLLSWFITQLNINHGIVDGEKHYGYGYKENSALKQFYQEWSEFEGYFLNITLASGMHENDSGSNYICYGWANIYPVFDENIKVVAVYVGNKEKEYRGEKYNVDNLELNDDSVSESLKELYHEYIEQVKTYDNNTDWFEDSDESLEDCDYIEFDYSLSKQFTDSENRVIYGTPGCGKSYYVENEILKNGNFNRENVFRTTFHQDYTNTDFVGQIMPVMKSENGKTFPSYDFIPGPFTLALECAYEHPSEKTALIIEELNRGNAPAVFGDLFQLLDRAKEDTEYVPKGTSEYGIKNIPLLNYLKTRNYKYFGSLTEIRLPSNLYIYATMNTSDQNVFTLDTAFKRRWKPMKLSNVFNGNEKIGNKFVPGIKGITWKEFVIALNDYMIKDNSFDSEDKQIGKYFVTEDMLLSEGESDDAGIKTEEFSYKVLEYLWSDVSKFDHSKYFNSKYYTLDEIIDAWKKGAGRTVFNDSIKFESSDE